jgi:tRNA-splicing ligase RtcB (3'-phosphate/5'-hydroxy nucleic acid ligase)
MEKKNVPKNALKKISEFLYEIPKNFRSDMLVPARVYVNEKLLENILNDNSLWQLINVTTLPGIQRYALAMPDIHEGYGFPIGGVAAMAIDEGGIISPGGIGYDINCGVRLLTSEIQLKEAKSSLEALASKIFHAVPSGVGKSGAIKLKPQDLDKILENGAAQMLSLGFGNEGDLNHCESNGCLDDASSSLVFDHAKQRGKDQLGTLGSGNHFLELQVVDHIFDEEAAKALNLKLSHITVMIHCGSRGLGHQVCSDYVRVMLNATSKYNINLVDRQLACAPFSSNEGQDYFIAMKAAANFAWANRHVIGHRVREAFHSIFGKNSALETVYDVAHNIGKLETHNIEGQLKKVILHRKGATRAFGPNHSELPESYKKIGQPVLIPGTMGTASYVLVGTKESMENSFGSSCHGAGRALSRHAAKKHESNKLVRQKLTEQGIVVCSDSNRGLAEEAPYAYKDIDDVIAVVHGASLAVKVARLKPIAVIKGD